MVPAIQKNRCHCTHRPIGPASKTPPITSRGIFQGSAALLRTSIVQHLGISGGRQPMSRLDSAFNAQHSAFSSMILELEPPPVRKDRNGVVIGLLCLSRASLNASGRRLAAKYSLARKLDVRGSQGSHRGAGWGGARRELAPRTVERQLPNRGDGGVHLDPRAVPRQGGVLGLVRVQVRPGH